MARKPTGRNARATDPAVASHYPSKGPKNPVESVSWDDCQQFLKKLNERFRRPHPGPPSEGEGEFRLPTEAQWEYACRAGSTTKYCFGDEESGLGEYAWYAANSGSKTHPVGEKKPNAWGLYDMHGNVWEWCQDWYDGGYYGKSATDDPTGPDTGSDRVIRGGFLPIYAWSCHSAFRYRNGVGDRNCNPFMGLRVSVVAAEAQVASPRLQSVESNNVENAHSPSTDVRADKPDGEQAIFGKKWVEILPNVNLERDRVKGEWAKEGNTVSTTAAVPESRIMLPVKVEGEYDLKVTFTLHEGAGHQADVILPVGSHYCLMIMGGWEGDKSCLECVDGQPGYNNVTTRQIAPLISERLYTLSVKVRAQNEHATIQASLDGKPLIDWQGKDASLSLRPGNELPQPQRIGLYTYGSLLTFHSAQLQIISGKASWVEGR